ncbi:MAG: hypothetical protein ABFR31_05765 [Thermodesulfobacteriota bacterium]
MKEIISLLIILFSATSAFAVDNPWDTKLPFKNVIIDSKISGTMNGEKTIYIKDYGKIRAEYSNISMKMMGMKQQQKEVIITTPDWVYTINQLENTGSKQANLKKFMIQEFNSLSKTEQKKVVKNAESQGIASIEGMEGTLEENAAEIMGYSCDKVTMAGTVVYIISKTDLVLKMNGNTMGVQMNQAATNIRKKSAPSSKFELPSNIIFEHDKQADQMMHNQAKSVIQELLKDNPGQLSSAGNYSNTQSHIPTPPQKSQAGGVLEEDAKDVGQAARQESKNSTIDEAKEGVRSVFKSIFN